MGLRLEQYVTEITLIFTLDYEIFGDGSGLVAREQCIPAWHLANILELHGARLTIFVETGQQIYFRSHDVKQQYAPVEAQLKELFARGHDVQLHIHPMWFYAPPPKEGRPVLDPDLYDLSLLDPADIEDIVARSCAYLTDLLSPVDTSYRPSAFRAGAWSMQRKDLLFEILARHGIRVDSTIAPGAHFAAGYGTFDFRQYEMKAFWSEGPLLEVPILTNCLPFGALQQLNRYGMMTCRIVNRIYPAPLAQKGQSKLGKLWAAATRGYFMADFNFLSPKQLARMIVDHARQHAGEGVPVPVVLIGHSKATYFADRLFSLFELLREADLRLQCKTLSAFSNGIAHHVAFPSE